MDLSWNNMKKIMIIVAFGIVLYMLLQNLVGIGEWISTFISIISPFILGSGIAFVINIPMKGFEKILTKNKKVVGKMIKVTAKNEKKSSKWKRLLAIILSFLVIIAVIVLVFKLVVPEFINVITSFIQYLTTLPTQIKPVIDDLLTEYPELGEELTKLQLDFSNILNTLIQFLKNAGSSFVGWASQTISIMINGVVNLVIGIISAVYILLSKEKIGKYYKKFILAYFPKKYATNILNVTGLSKTAFTNFITGQLKEAIILGVLCYFGMLILGLPYSLTISVLIMVTALIPIVGAIVGTAVGVILLLSVSPAKAITFLVFIIVLQQIEANLIYPKVVGESVGVPSLFVLVAITIGGSLGGVLGVLVSLPIASVLYTLLKASINKKLKEKNITESV